MLSPQHVTGGLQQSQRSRLALQEDTRARAYRKIYQSPICDSYLSDFFTIKGYLRNSKDLNNLERFCYKVIILIVKCVKNFPRIMKDCL